ncbi:hypothetical protein C0J52_12463 [Blattella germanica]|nr:hypothetical protein C0J52_12463 [Blattella germanica]
MWWSRNPSRRAGALKFPGTINRGADLSSNISCLFQVNRTANMKAVIAVLALLAVFAVAFAAEPAKDLKGAEQFYGAYPYAAYGGYAAYPYAGYASYGYYGR